MRILFLSPIGEIGGAERVLLDLIEAIKIQSPDVELHLLLLADGPLAIAARALGANVTVLSVPQSVATLGNSAAENSDRFALIIRAVRALPATLGLANRLRRAIQDIRPDIVHSIGVKTHLLLGLARPKGARVVWHIHDLVGARLLVAGLLRRIAPRNVTTVAISQAVADDVRRWLPRAEVHVVLNGIDTSKFSTGAGDPRWLDERAGWIAPDNVIRVGLVATYARWKGQDVFIRAAAKLAREPANANLRFYIVGGPIYTTRGSQFSAVELQQLIDSSGMRDRVALTGRADDLVHVYRALDVVVHASMKPEPFGLTIAEAMSCGRAVVVSAAGGARELFTPNTDAIGIQPGDIDTMADAIARLARDAELRQSLGAAARHTVVANFDRARTAHELLSVYKSLLPA